MHPPRLFLIDTFGFVFRAYHARARSGAPPMRTSTGLPTEAVYIFHNMLRKLMTSYKPEYVAAVFESLGPTFRSESFVDYKANRAEMPSDLAQQVPYVRRLLEALRIPILEFAGFEADDVIGAIARRASADEGLDVVIVSSDKDLLQLVDERTHMYNPMKEDVWYDPRTTEEFMGVPPSAVSDLLALKGDAIDNIPGAPGIGDKGARDLVARFGSVEAAIERAAEVERKTYRESLQANRDQILLSKKLATVDTTVPVDWCLASLVAQEADVTALRQMYKELEFFSLLRELKPVESTAGKDYATLAGPDEVIAWVAKIPAGALLAVGLNSGIGLCWQPGVARVVPAGLMVKVRGLLEDASHRKIAHDVKSALLALEQHDITARGFRDDVMLYAFLLSADPGGCGCEVLAEKYLDVKLGASAEMRADCVLALGTKLAREVDERGFRKLYDEIDFPLIEVLIAMERTGIRIAPAELERLSGRMDSEMQRLSARVHELAGHEFNLNSPQQLAKVLYEELNLPSPTKYGRGKSMSTAADILEALAAEHEIARLVLDYRQIAKLKGTYVDALPALIRPSTGRVHTTYNQAGAATGRLSSSNPNLQNIPIRTELGREIRAAFVPRDGWQMLVADYSQIELRLLAHMSGCPALLSAFRAGEDIHTRTAAEVFAVPPLMITPEMRRRAKAVNFGIVYGQTPFGLASQLSIDRKEAERYIRNYFEVYAGVKKFIETTVAEVRSTGVAKTLFGRERPIPDMNSRNPNARSFAERTAVNTPLQGTAADLIKIAMIRIHRLLNENKLRGKMLLQVHDELLFEAPPEEADSLRNLVKREMEGVAKLQVPLVVDVGVGPNWRDAK